MGTKEQMMCLDCKTMYFAEIDECSFDSMNPIYSSNQCPNGCNPRNAVRTLASSPITIDDETNN